MLDISLPRRTPLLIALSLCVAVLLAAMPVRAQTVYPVQAGAMDAWLLPDDTLPLITTRILIERSGSAYDPPGKEGLAYLTANMLTEGAGTLRDGAFQKQLDFHAISLSLSTYRDYIVIDLECLSEHLPKAYELLGLMLTKPRFDEPALRRIRAEHLSRLAQLQEEPSFRLSRAFYQTAFSDHPYSRPVYGSAESVNTLTPSDMRAYMNRHLSQQQLTISVAGDIDTATLQQMLTLHLGDIPKQRATSGQANAGTPSDLPQAPLITQGSTERVVMDGLPQNRVRIALPGIARNDERFYAGFILNHILGGGSLSSRLGEALRQERGLTYSVNSHLAIQDAAHWLSIDFATQNARTEEAIEVTLNTLRNTSKNGVSAEELKSAKQYLTGAFPLNLDTNQERVGYLTSMQRYQLGTDYLKNRNEVLHNVTLEQINALADSLLDPTNNHLIITAGGPYESDESSK